MTVSDGDEVTIEYVGRLENGELFDTSDKALARQEDLVEKYPDRQFEPLRVTVGDDQVIEGLQEALRGLEEGDETVVEIPPELAYGRYQESRVAEYDRDDFEEMMGDRDLEIGFEVEVKESGLPGRVVDYDDEEVTVDFNHELAGDTLQFEIEVTNVA